MELLAPLIHLNWYSSTLLSAFLYGCLNFCYKLAASKGLAGPQVVNKAALTVTLWALLFLVLSPPPFVGVSSLLLFAVLNSAFFSISATSKLTALQSIPTSYFFPLSKMSLAIVIILSLSFLGEAPNIKQWIGIGMIASTIGLMTVDNKRAQAKVENLGRGLFFTLFVVFGTGLSVFVGKLASTRVDKLSYIFTTYLITMIITFFISRIQKHRHLGFPLPSKKRASYFFGFVIGSLNFFGYILVLHAFSLGPLSLIQSISTISIILPVFLSVIFLKEKLTWRRILMLALAVGATVFMKN